MEPECPNALHPKCGAVDIFFYERKRAKKAGARGIRTTAVYVAVGAAYAPVPKPVAPAFRASLDSGLSRPFGDTQRMGFVNMATQTSPPSHPQYRARAIHSLRQSVQRTTPDIENGPPPPPPPKQLRCPPTHRILQRTENRPRNAVRRVATHEALRVLHWKRPPQSIDWRTRVLPLCRRDGKG